MMPYSAMIPQLERIVKSIREELLKNHSSHINNDLTGLCDEVWNILKQKINESNESYVMKILYKASMIPFRIHGELNHSVKINPDNWGYQHTWYAVMWTEYDHSGFLIPPKHRGVIYIDPTCQQFQWLFTDIPDYYIHPIPPKWFYWDKYNPAFVGIRRWWINTRCKTRLQLLIEGRNRPKLPKWYQNFIMFIQYKIKGNVYKAYRWIRGIKDEGY